MKSDDAQGRPAGDFALRPLRAGETFELLQALKLRQRALEMWEGFREFGTSINAITSIILTDRATLFPMPGQLEWLVKCFERWHNASGKLTMDQAMGLTPTYKGGETDAVRCARTRRDQLTAQHMAQLTALGFSARAASRLVAQAIERSNHPPVSSSTIQRAWPRMKREGRAWLPLVVTVTRAMTASERKEYLRQYGGPRLPNPPKAQPKARRIVVSQTRQK